MANEPRLVLDPSAPDYRLEGGDHVWINVKNISVHIKQGDEGVSVTLYPAGREDDDESLSEAWATYAEAESE